MLTSFEKFSKFSVEEILTEVTKFDLKLNILSESNKL